MKKKIVEPDNKQIERCNNIYKQHLKQGCTVYYMSYKTTFTTTSKAKEKACNTNKSKSVQHQFKEKRAILIYAKAFDIITCISKSVQLNWYAYGTFMT